MALIRNPHKISYLKLITYLIWIIVEEYLQLQKDPLESEICHTDVGDIFTMVKSSNCDISKNKI